MLSWNEIRHRAIIPDNDRDCFCIRIKGAARFGLISVKVGTADNPEPAKYDDDPTQIDLHADGDDMVSDTQLLVADDEDDLEPIGGVADDQPNDRTHKIQLGGNFVISAVKVGIDPWMAIELKTPVKVVKTVQVNAVIFYNKAISAGGVLAATHPQVEEYFKTTKERYAQVGVKIVMIGPVDREPPAGVDLTGPLVISQNNESFVLFNDPKLLIQEAGTLDASDIHVFFVPQAKYAIGLPFLGTSLPQFAYGASDGDYIYNAFISMDKINSLEQGGLAVAHELGHLLRNGGHETWIGEDSLIQLMVDHSFKLDGVLSSKRFTIADEIKIQNDSHAH